MQDSRLHAHLCNDSVLLQLGPRDVLLPGDCSELDRDQALEDTRGTYRCCIRGGDSICFCCDPVLRKYRHGMLRSSPTHSSIMVSNHGVRRRADGPRHGRGNSLDWCCVPEGSSTSQTGTAMVLPGLNTIILGGIRNCFTGALRLSAHFKFWSGSIFWPHDPCFDTTAGPKTNSGFVNPATGGVLAIFLVHGCILFYTFHAHVHDHHPSVATRSQRPSEHNIQLLADDRCCYAITRLMERIGVFQAQDYPGRGKES